VGIDDSLAGEPAGCCQCGQISLVPANRFAPGAVLGDFVLEEELGVGGIGWVYRAVQLSTGVRAALKVLDPALFENAAYVQEFLREAAAAAQISHPNLARFLEVGEEDGYYYFATEFVSGGNLKQILQHSGRLLADRALLLAEQVAAALAAAWSGQKLVHGDIKPENIIIGEDGSAKLIDLGMARPAAPVRDPRFREVAQDVHYLSPEALLGQARDARSDFFSLGVTLYEALTGELPFPEADPGEVAHEVLLEPLVPPNQVKADLPPAASRVVEILLAKRPEHRYQDAEALRQDLAAARRGAMPRQPLVKGAQRPLPVDPVTLAKLKKPVLRKRPLPKPAGSGRRWLVWGGVAAGVAAAIGVALWLGLRGERAPVPAPAAVAPVAPGPAAVAGKEAGAPPAAAPVKHSPAEVNLYAALRAAVQAGRPAAEILRLVDEFERQFPANQELLGKVRELAAPFRGAPPPPASAASFDRGGSGLRGRYYQGAEFEEFVFERLDPQMDFQWDTAAPDPRLKRERFSVRWEGELEPPVTGPYRFHLRGDDGFQLWVDGQPLVARDSFRAQEETSPPVTLAAGRRAALRLDYFQRQDKANLALSWSGPGFSGQPIPKGVLFPAKGERDDLPRQGGLRGFYFSGTHFDNFVAARLDPRIDFAWGTGAPAGIAGLPADRFSVCWKGRLVPKRTGPHTFHLVSDDGARLWLGGILLIDVWSLPRAVENTATAELVAGKPVPLMLEYFENAGGASVRLSWAAAGLKPEVIPPGCLLPAGEGERPPAASALPPPSAVPGGGKYQDAVRVAVTPPQGAHELRYTVDDSPVRAGSPPLRGPLLVDRPLTLRVRAFRQDGMPGEELRAAYEVRPAPPIPIKAASTTGDRKNLAKSYDGAVAKRGSAACFQLRGGQSVTYEFAGELPLARLRLARGSEEGAAVKLERQTADGKWHELAARLPLRGRRYEDEDYPFAGHPQAVAVRLTVLERGALVVEEIQFLGVAP
jgi:tRNA A-37 threonylcarbamoyl transferase component Bud32